MGWQEIVGHENILDRFQRSYRCDRLASTYLFVGREGIGKRTFAMKLAQALFCENRSGQLEPCDTCPNCVQVNSRSHPDLILVSKPEDKNFIPVELFLGDREHRRRQGLCHDINLTPFAGDRKIAIIDDADFLNAESANSLLKTLEEPPPNSILILIGTSEHRQLPTILSRAQVVRFQPLSYEQVGSILQKHSLTGDVPPEKLAAASEGSISRALQLDNDELFAFREQLYAQLVTLDPADNGFSKTVCEFVDATSKEASVRRLYLRTIADFAIQLFNNTLYLVFDSEQSKSFGPELSSCASRLVANLHRSNRSPDETIVRWIERTIVFQSHVDANLATPNIVPSWLNDLGAIARNELTQQETMLA